MEMIKRMTIAMMIMLAFFSFSPAGQLDKDLILSLEARQVENLTEESCNFVIYINIANGSPKSYFLTRYRYRFIVEESEYLQMNRILSEGLEVSPSGKTMISIPVKITYENLFNAIEKTRNLDAASCYLLGELFFSEGRKDRGSLPIAHSGEFPIFKAPRVEVVGLKANAVSLGGADLDFQFKMVNENGFGLRVDEIKYRLHMDGFPISEGRINGDKDVTGRDEKFFSLHLLINYFEVGKEFQAVLQKEDLVLSFEGEIEFRTAWGRMVVPFLCDERIIIAKRI